MYHLLFRRPSKQAVQTTAATRRKKPLRAAASSAIESLEPRTLFSESASAQLTLVSTTGTQQAPVYHYDIAVKDTGTTDIGTFWFAWVPGEDFLPSAPTSESNPTGWTSTVTGSDDSADGSAIEWVASSSPIMPGQTLSGFDFVTPDSPSALAANSPDYPSTPAMTSTVYSGAAFSDGGAGLVVAPASTPSLTASTTTVNSSATSITQGNSVTFTATVSGTGGTPGGTVTFLSNGASIGTGTLTSGTAAFTTTSLPAGALSITAQYGGDSTFAASTAAAITQTVNAAPSLVSTTTSLVSSSPTAVVGTSVSLTATITPVTVGVAPTGTVNFTQGSQLLGTVALQGNGTATLTTSSLAVGADPVLATYGGDGNFASSASTTLTQTITPPADAVATTATLTSSAATAVIGTSVTLTATITPATAGATPTGSVTFTQDGVTLGTAALQADGTATLALSSLAQGADAIVAGYPGDINYAASTSAPLTVTITPPPTLVPAVTKSTVPTAIVAGAAAHGVVTFDITNDTGTAIKGKKSTLAVYASTSGSIDTASILVAQVMRPLNVKTTKPTLVSIPIKLAPGKLSAGAYQLFVRVTDPTGTANDSAAGPALAVAAPFIRLSEALVKSTIPATASSGDKLHSVAILNITNNGNITTPATTTAALFATQAGTIDSTAVEINAITKPLRIHAGKSTRVTIAVKLLPALPAGSYTLVAQVTDPNGALTTVTVGLLTIA